MIFSNLCVDVSRHVFKTTNVVRNSIFSGRSVVVSTEFIWSQTDWSYRSEEELWWKIKKV